MRHRQELHREGAYLHGGGPRLKGVNCIERQPSLFKLQPANAGGELAGIDRLFQKRPQMPQGADVVLMGVGDHDAIQPVKIFHQPRQIGQNQIDTGAAVHVREGHPQIDQHQPLFPRFAIAVDIGIHADFTGTPKGKIDQAFAAHTVSLL